MSGRGSATRMARYLGATVIGAMGLFLVPWFTAPATATTAPLVWSAPAPVDLRQGHPSSVTCESASNCTAVDQSGAVRQWNGSSWSGASVIDTGNQLTSVSCNPSTGFCAAVDATGHALHAGAGTGPAWATVTDIDGSNQLTSVSCGWTDVCWAVDTSGNGLEWTGSSWSPASDIDASRALSSVSCPTFTFCMAVDASGYALSWNGSSWSPPSDIDGSLALSSVSCSSATSCAAVDASGNVLTWGGSSWSAASGIDSGRSLRSISCYSATLCAATDSAGHAVMWNGASWSAPSDIDGSSDLVSVACAAASFCVAVDSSLNSLSWSGSSWSAAASMPASDSPTAVSCSSASFCAAVDATGSALTWNGASWSAPVGNDPDTPVNAVSCLSSTFCMAVDGNGEGLRWNGLSWGAPVNGAEGSAVSCVSSSLCWAVGGGGVFTAASEWTGSSWTSTALSGAFSLTAVSCVTSSFCMAVDGSGHGFTWNGASWSTAATIEDFGSLNSVSCGSVTFCVAVDGNGGAFTWKGTSWSAASSIDPGYSLTSVSCPSATFCTAVDNSGGILSWDGSSWSSPAIGDGTDDMTSVSCPSASFCAAVDASGNALTAAPPTPLPYTPVTPTRICDTRPAGPGIASNQCDTGGNGTLGDQTTLTITVPGLPAGATAAVLNVTVADTDARSFLTVWPAGTSQPNASNLNWTPGKVVPNLVEVALGAGNEVNLFNMAGDADVIVDLEGYVAPAGAGTGLFTPLSPSRICDTRAAGPGIGANQCDGNGTTTGTLGHNGVLSFQVTGLGGVPASGVSAVVLNVTVADTSASSFLTVWPAGQSRPTASNLNWSAGHVVPNRVIVPVGSGGMVSVYNLAGSADVIVDVGGWFTDASNPSATGASFVPLSPARICDTRGAGSGVGANQCNGNGTTTGTLGAGGTRTVAVAGEGGVPASGVVGVVANVTVTNTTGSSFLTAWPDLTSRPTASDLNWSAGVTVPNLVVAKLGTDGALDLYNLNGSTDVIVDVEGYYTG